MEWPGEEEFIRSISKVKSSKEPLSATKIQVIAQNAFSDLKVVKNQNFLSPNDTFGIWFFFFFFFFFFF